MQIIGLSLIIFFFCFSTALALKWLISGHKAFVDRISLGEKDKHAKAFIVREESFKMALRDRINHYLKITLPDFKSCEVFVFSVFYGLDRAYVAEAIVHCKDSSGVSYDKFVQIGYGMEMFRRKTGGFEEYIIEDFTTFESSNGFKDYLSCVAYGLDIKLYREFMSEDICERSCVLPYTFADRLHSKWVRQNPVAKDLVEDIKMTITEMSSLSKVIDDIDIMVSVDELSQNTDIVLETIDSFEETKGEELLKEYKEALTSITSYLEEFKSLKASGKLSTELEESLQDKIDEYVNKCSHMANL